MRVNGLYNNESSPSSTAESLKILSYPSTYVVKLSEKSSEDQLKKNSAECKQKVTKNLMLSIKHWVCKFYFGQGYGTDQKIIKN